MTAALTRRLTRGDKLGFDTLQVTAQLPGLGIARLLHICWAMVSINSSVALVLRSRWMREGDLRDQVLDVPNRR